jgi:hypothetical protein
MINVRRNDFMSLPWLLERQDSEPGYCTDPTCPNWCGGHVEERYGVRWCDSFWEHCHVEDWQPADDGHSLVPR